MESHLRTELVVSALEMALWRRQPASGLIHHSDQGVQYTSLSFGKRLEQAGIVPSMGRVGSALDNAISESFVATLKAELVDRSQFPSREIAKTAIFEYLEAFYNRTRIHSSLGYKSPSDFEEATMREASLRRKENVSVLPVLPHFR
jgi:putative transposase